MINLLKMVPKIALCMMVKNEHKRLHVTLDSVVDFVTDFIIADTGSTDSTISILEHYSKKYNKPLHLIEYPFENFEQSRNKLLDFADDVSTSNDIDLLLLLDCNDELRNGLRLLQLAPRLISSHQSAWMLCQEWYSPTIQTYYNVRLIKPNKTWRYIGVVHEYIKKLNEPDLVIIEKIPDIVLYQDRLADDDKTGHRFNRDYELLLNEHKNNPTEPRTVFYLAQTCKCLHKYQEAYDYYALRSTMTHGFYEEVYLSRFECGKLSEENLNMPWEISIGWYLKSAECIPRAEAFVKIAHHYRNLSQWCLAYYFCKIACDQDYPTNQHLWIDNNVYNWERYHLMGIIAYYYNKFDEGIEACKKAIQFANLDIDKQNLEFYQNKLKMQNGGKQHNKLIRRR